MGLRERIEARREGREVRIEQPQAVQPVRQPDPRPTWVARMQDERKIPRGVQQSGV
jgi:hypothetical protein